MPESGVSGGGMRDESGFESIYWNMKYFQSVLLNRNAYSMNKHWNAFSSAGVKMNSGVIES